MSEGRFRGVAGPAIAVFVLIVVAPIVLFGERLSAASLVLASVCALAAGLLLRSVGGASRPVGTTLVLTGVLAVGASLGLVILLLAGWGRGY